MLHKACFQSMSPLLVGILFSLSPTRLFFALPTVGRHARCIILYTSESEPKNEPLTLLSRFVKRKFEERLTNISWKWVEMECNDFTVEPRYNEPLYSEVLGITNDNFCPSNQVIIKYLEKNLHTSFQNLGPSLHIEIPVHITMSLFWYKRKI